MVYYIYYNMGITLGSRYSKLIYYTIDTAYIIVNISFPLAGCKKSDVSISMA